MMIAVAVLSGWRAACRARQLDHQGAHRVVVVVIAQERRPRKPQGGEGVVVHLGRDEHDGEKQTDTAHPSTATDTAGSPAAARCRPGEAPGERRAHDPGDRAAGQGVVAWCLSAVRH